MAGAKPQRRRYWQKNPDWPTYSQNDIIVSISDRARWQRIQPSIETLVALVCFEKLKTNHSLISTAKQ